MFKKNLVNILSMVFTFFKVIMKSKSRIALWCFLAFIYVLFIVITHFFNIPLKSRSGKFLLLFLLFLDLLHLLLYLKHLKACLVKIVVKLNKIHIPNYKY